MFLTTGALLRQLEECHALFHEEHQHAETKPEQTHIEEHSEHESSTNVTTTSKDVSNVMQIHVVSISACIVFENAPYNV